VSHPQRGRLREDHDQPAAPQARRPARCHPSSRPSPKPATGCYGFPGSSRRPLRSGGRSITSTYMIRPLTTSRLSIALRRKKRDAPVAGAVRTLGAGFGIEALAEVVTATAAGDKAKVAHMASSRSPFSSSRPPVRRLAPGTPRAQKDARLPREDHSRAARARARADQAPGSSAFGKTREPPSSARVT